MMNFIEKRSEDRFPCRVDLDALVMEKSRYLKACVRNFSDSGLFMETGMDMHPGDHLVFLTDRGIPRRRAFGGGRPYTGVVKSCRQLHGGTNPCYGIGVTLLEKMDRAYFGAPDNSTDWTASGALRRVAEKYLLDHPQADGVWPDAEARRLLHELHVHQIELEIQNEELRRAEQAAATATARYQDLYDYAPAGYFTFDPNGLIAAVNLTGAEMLRTPRGELVGKPFALFVLEEDRDLFRKHRHAVVNTTHRQKDEIRLQRKSSAPIHVCLESSLLQGADTQPDRVTTIIMDVTERKMIEQQNQLLAQRLEEARKMEAIGTLAGGVAHDFNNLLMGMQGSVELIQLAMHPDTSQAPHLERVRKLIRRAADLTQQLLGFARGGKYNVRAIELDSLLQGSVTLFAGSRRDIDIQTHFESEHCIVSADRGQLERAFMNLFINAHQAMPEGGRLTITTRSVELEDTDTRPHHLPAGRYIRITVADTGVGMDAETCRKIFEPFFTTREMGQGTGLGLATVYGIITSHKGFIEVESRPGRGTRFVIHLPAIETEADRVDTPERKELPRGTETVLLVDDEPGVRQAVAQMLEYLGYRVLVAPGGKEALERYDAAAVDLVLLDMTMPGMDGGKTFERLRALNPTVKVVLASGYSRQGRVKEIAARGCKGFIQKPYSLEVLAETLRAVLDG